MGTRKNGAYSYMIVYRGRGLWIDVKNPKIFTNTKNANICRFFSIYKNIRFLVSKNEYSLWMFKRKTNETEKDQRIGKKNLKNAIFICNLFDPFQLLHFYFFSR